MSRRATVPAELGSAFALGEATAAGLTRRQLERPDLDRRFRGVRMHRLAAVDDEAPAETWRRELLRLAEGYRLRMLESEFLSHRTAAVIWRLPVDTGGRPILDVSVFHPDRAPRSLEVDGHQVRRELATTTRHAGFRLTSPATTWAMLGATSTVHELVVLGDAIARIPRRPGGFGPPDGPPLGSIDQLRAAAEAGRRPGVERLRAALPLIRCGSSSRRETELRLHVIAAGFPEPVLDLDVYDEQGRFLGCSELAFPEFRVALEYEGDHHRTSRRQWDRDIDKYQLYIEAEWLPIRVTNRLLIENPVELDRRIEAALRSRGWRGS